MPSNPTPTQRNIAYRPTSNTAKPSGNGVGLRHRRAALSQKVSFEREDLTSVQLLLAVGTLWPTTPTVVLRVWTLSRILNSSNKRPGGRLRESTKVLTRHWWRTPN